MRYRISALMVVMLLVAVAMKFVPVFFADKEETGYQTKGSGSYVWFDNTRSLLSDRDLDLAKFLSNSQNGNLVWIEHTCAIVDPDIVGGWSYRKILIQLPKYVYVGDRFHFQVQETSRTGVNPSRLNAEMSNFEASLFIFDEGGDANWICDVQQFTTGQMKIINMTPTSVSISLEMPDNVTMQPDIGAIPNVLNLTRRLPNAR